eukprot:SAG22_NODE_2818_length_2181_cov_1.579731_2_plen_341_part_01
MAFASFGNPLGSCRTANDAATYWGKGECDDVNTTKVVSELCLGKNTCAINATTAAFGGVDPCGGTSKKLAVQLHCTDDPPLPPACSAHKARADCRTAAAAAHCSWNETTKQCGQTPPPRPSLWSHDEHTAVSKGNVVVTNGSFIYFLNSTFQHLGGYASSALGGSQNVHWRGCHFHDISSGALMLGDLQHCNETDTTKWDCNFTISDNTIVNLPVERGFSGATAIFGAYVASVLIEHNHIANTSYTGIDLGWGWGATGCRRGDNHVIANRLENPDRQRCCDGGQVYTLGPQPGSSIERNLLIRHDNIPDELGAGPLPPNAICKHGAIGSSNDQTPPSSYLS